MFGRNDEDNQQAIPADTASVATAPPITDTTQAGETTDTMPNQMVMPQNPISDPLASPQPVTTDPSVSTSSSTAVPADTPLPEGLAVPATDSNDESTINNVDPNNNYPVDETPQITSDYGSKPGPALVGGDVEDELIDIKKKALESLAPLVDELDQSPEDKFKTTMMLIQASDNAELIKDAFAAANAISDEKSRAQALLDVVNEINYFTQHQESPAETGFAA